MSVDILKMFAVNEERANGGVWVPFMGNVECRIARTGNHQYKKLAQRHFKTHGRMLEQENKAAEEKGMEITIDLIANTILLEWRGDDMQYDGKPLPYSIENAKLLLAQEGFREWVQEQSKDQKNFKEYQDEEEEKN